MTSLSIPARLAEQPRTALLRLALKVDAIITGANGVVYVAAANPLEDVLGVEPALTRSIGAFLVLFAAAVWLVARRPTVPRGGVTAVIEVNVLWVLGSIAFAVAAVSSPTTAGTVWIVLQALVVGGFAALQSYARPGRM
jgi:hypothetical protein